MLSIGTILDSIYDRLKSVQYKDGEVTNLSSKHLLKMIEVLLRLWLAYVLITNSVVGTYVPLENLGMPPDIYHIIKSMWDTGFMMHLVKAIELLSGIALLFNFYVPVALLLLFPVVINIYGFYVFLFKNYVSTGLMMVVGCIFLAYRHREKYRHILTRK